MFIGFGTEHGTNGLHNQQSFVLALEILKLRNSPIKFINKLLKEPNAVPGRKTLKNR